MADEEPLGERLVAAIHAVTAPTPGHRALHAKGIGVTGRFEASGDAGSLTKAQHLQPGANVPVTVRFSNGSGDPTQADEARDGRGFSTRFHLPDGSNTDLVTLTLPVFFVRTVDDFLTLMASRVPDPETGQPDFEKMFAFIGAHPEANRAVELSMNAPNPKSYATLEYHGVHAFWMENDAGERQAIKYHWSPDAGVEVLDSEGALDADPDYLQVELRTRLAEKLPASFTLHLQLAGDGDPVDDPTTEWPDDRPTVVAGRLILDDVPDDQAAIDGLIFDPTRVTDGIECSDDEILRARAEAYGASYTLRRG